MMRGGLTILLALSCGLSMPPAAADNAAFVNPEVNPQAASVPSRPVSHVDRLLVNTANTVRYVTEGRSELEGIGEIRAILERSRFEEMWVYVPDAVPGRPGRWHEIGRGESSDVLGARVPVDWRYLEALMARHGVLTLYHFHPLAYFECATHAACSASLHATASPGTRDTRLLADIRFSMPSPADIHFMMETTWLFHRHHRGSGAIRHRVVTPHGIVDYALTDAGFEKYAADRGARTQGLYIPWVAASKLTDDNIRSIVNETPGDYPRLIGRLVETLNTRYLTVTYIADD